jgi:transcriptional regulator with XRE-family HTH domain
MTQKATPTPDPLQTLLASLASLDVSEMIRAVNETPTGGVDLAVLFRRAMQAGIVLGRAEKDGGREPPAEALAFLAMLSGAKCAPEGFREIRKSLGIDQDEIAKRCGVARDTISRWENGDAPIPPTALYGLVSMVLERGGPVSTASMSGSDLVTLRTRLGMTRKQFAVELGISAPMVRKLEMQDRVSRVSLHRIRPRLAALQQKLAA